MKTVDQDCPDCTNLRFYALEYQAPEYDVNVHGGWFAVLVAVDDESLSDYERSVQCRCALTAEQVTALEDAMSYAYRDYSGHDGD